MLTLLFLCAAEEHLTVVKHYLPVKLPKAIYNRKGREKASDWGVIHIKHPSYFKSGKEEKAWLT